jgi:hypothetical protein
MIAHKSASVHRHARDVFSHDTKFFLLIFLPSHQNMPASVSNNSELISVIRREIGILGSLPSFKL